MASRKAGPDDARVGGAITPLEESQAPCGHFTQAPRSDVAAQRTSTAALVAMAKAAGCVSLGQEPPCVTPGATGQAFAPTVARDARGEADGGGGRRLARDKGAGVGTGAEAGSNVFANSPSLAAHI